MDSIESQAETSAAEKITPISKSSLGMPEDNQLPVSSQGMASDLDNLASSVSTNISKSIPKVLEAEKEKGEAAKTEATGEAEEWQKYQKELRDIYKEGKPSPMALQAAPKLPDDDPLRNFGSLASMIGIFASAFTKKPIVNALNASADAMKAEQSGNKEAYDLAYNQWKDQTELAFKRHDTELKDLNEIMDIAQTDHAAGLAELKAWGVVNSSQAATMLAELGDWEEIGKWVSSQQSALTKAKEASAKIEDQNLQKQVYRDALEANIKSGMPKGQAEAMAMAASKGKAIGASGLTDDEYQEKYANDPVIEQLARAYAKGATLQQVVPGWRNDNPKRDAVIRKAEELFPDLNWADAHARYMGEQSEKRAVGTQTAKINLASNMLDKSLPSMMDAARKVGLTPSTDLNAVYNSLKRHASNKDLSNFSTQLRAVTSDYAQFIGRGRLTVHSDEEALRILNEDMGITSLQGFVDAVNTERTNVNKAIAVTKGEKDEDEEGGWSIQPADEE